MPGYSFSIPFLVTMTLCLVTMPQEAQTAGLVCCRLSHEGLLRLQPGKIVGKKQAVSGFPSAPPSLVRNLRLLGTRDPTPWVENLQRIGTIQFRRIA
jgi:hypothetical protein